MCDRINLVQHGEITFDKRSADTSVTELTEIVVAEYRKALADRQPARTGPPTIGELTAGRCR